MSQQQYCYHCRSYHDVSVMRQVVCGSALRWRCVRSIEGAKRSSRERDAFGKTMTAQNSQAARELAKRARHREFYIGKA